MVVLGLSAMIGVTSTEISRAATITINIPDCSVYTQLIMVNNVVGCFPLAGRTPPTDPNQPPVSTPVPVPTPNTTYCTADDVLYNVPWNDPAQQVKITTSNFGKQVISFKVTVPKSLGPAYNVNSVGFMHIVEVPGQAVVARDATVSKIPCDFSSGKYLYYNVGVADNAPGVNFSVNNPNTSSDFTLNYGDVVYLNIRNRNIDKSYSCPQNTCNVFLDFAPTNR